MKRPPRYVQAFVDQHGRPRFYLRRRGFKKVPLPGLPWSPEFMTAYETALAGRPAPIGASRTKVGTINAAIIGYYQNQPFVALGAGTRIMYRQILERFRTDYGEKDIRLLQRQHITAILSPKKPFAARNWLNTLRSLMKYAVEVGLREEDPTAGVKAIRIKSDGHHSWSEGEIEQFDRRHGPETKARLAMALLLYTGQRRGDVIRIGRQHIRDGVVHIRQQKTGIELAIPIHANLAEIITGVNNLTLLTTEYGKPFSATGFSPWFRTRCNEAGLPHCSAHGLRKAAARRLAEAGCTMHEIAAITGHASLSEVQRYTKAADQARLARMAMDKTRK
jgi:integrase